MPNHFHFSTIQPFQQTFSINLLVLIWQQYLCYAVYVAAAAAAAAINAGETTNSNKHNTQRIV